ncbi:MAG: hypothetical protein IIW26_02220 [Tidjanibacter sp.]|nr:hypothetical protein [Tidjanibacter sp.]
MLRFDKLKIVSNIENINSINENVFQSVIKDGKIQEQKFSIQSPYSLYIEADYIERELVIEFSGKILKDDYPSLIHRDNIHICLDNINELGLCSLDVESILADGVVVKADVCQDVDCADCKALTQSLRAGVKNFKKYLVRNIGENFVIEKNVLTKGYKRRLTVYDKEREMQRASNRKFLEGVEDKDLLLSAFKDKVRFELNLNSKEQIRRSLNIADTTIPSVLNTSAAPIWDFLDGAIADGEGGAKCTTLTELKNQLLLEYCGNDLARVEALLRNYCSPNTHISQVMKPYRALAAKLSDNLTPTIKQTLRNLLLEIIFWVGIFI